MSIHHDSLLTVNLLTAMSGTFYAIANEPSHATQSYTRTLRGVRAPIFLVTILVDTFRRPWELDLAVALPKAVKVDISGKPETDGCLNVKFPHQWTSYGGFSRILMLELSLQEAKTGSASLAWMACKLYFLISNPSLCLCIPRPLLVTKLKFQ